MKASQVITLIETDRKNLEFMPTHWKNLDSLLDGGFLKKEVVVIGGSTGVGKSYFSGQLLANVARSGFKTAYFSLEISNEMMVSRLIGAFSNINSTHIVSDMMQPEAERKYIETKAKIELIEDYMDFHDNIYDFNTIAKLVKANGYEFIVVDFLQILAIEGHNEYERMTNAATWFQKLAKETSCCIVLLSQLSNDQATTDISKIMYPQYKGSGAIAMVADQAFYLLRNDEILLQSLGLLWLKNRRGARPPQPLVFDFKLPGGRIYERAN